MNDNFSPRVKDVIVFSQEEALRLGHDYIGTEHLVLGMIREGSGKAITILQNLDIDLDNLRKKVEVLYPADPSAAEKVLANEKKNLRLTVQADRALKTTQLEVKLYPGSTINTATLLLCILRNDNDPTMKLLENMGVDYTKAKEKLKQMIGDDADYTEDFPSADSFSNDDEDSNKEIDVFYGQRRADTKCIQNSNTPVLDNFGRDLTALAIEGKLDPVKI